MTRMIAATILALLAAGPLAAAEGDTLTGPATVVDGDTLDVAGQRMRLWGVSAPERWTAEGRAATAQLRRIVAGRTVRCVHTGGWTYGRWEAQCFAAYPDGPDPDGAPEWLDVGAALILSGHASEAPEFSGGYYGGD